MQQRECCKVGFIGTLPFGEMQFVKHVWKLQSKTNQNLPSEITS